MILNQTVCSPVQKEEKREGNKKKKEKEHKAATNEENGWGPAAEKGGSGKLRAHKLTLKSQHVRARPEHAGGHIKCTY